jgi:hypothetical protein
MSFDSAVWCLDHEDLTVLFARGVERVEAGQVLLFDVADL